MMRLHEVTIKNGRGPNSARKSWIRFGCFVIAYALGLGSAFLIASRSVNESTAEQFQATNVLEENLLLLSQQVEQLFRTSHEISATGLSDKSYRELLRVFDEFDSRFLETNQGNVSADVYSSFAYARQGVVAKYSGDLQEAKRVYRKVIDHIDQTIDHEPVAGMLFTMMLDARMNLVVLEKETGDTDASTREYKIVVDLLSDPRLPKSAYIDDWLSPLCKNIALIGIDLGCLPDALEAAHRFSSFATSAASDFPDKPELQANIVDSARLVENIKSLIDRQTAKEPK